jgi:hypothetical protein
MTSGVVTRLRYACVSRAVRADAASHVSIKEGAVEEGDDPALVLARFRVDAAGV